MEIYPQYQVCVSGNISTVLLCYLSGGKCFESNNHPDLTSFTCPSLVGYLRVREGIG